MRPLIPLVAAVLAALTSLGAAADTFESLQWQVGAEAISTSDVMPSSGASGPDRGAATVLEINSAFRLPERIKLIAGASVEVRRFDRVTIAGYEEYRGVLSARRGGTQFVVETAWTPERIKFEDDAGTAVFERIESTFGIRQTFPRALRARFELSRRRDAYGSLFDARDASGPAWRGRLDWGPGKAVTLRGEFGGENSRATSPKHTQRERWASGTVVFVRGPWTIEPWVVSGVARYPDALASDSNYRRRDQWLESGLRGGFAMRPNFRLLLTGVFLDQTSSRPDRTYDVGTVRAGIEWSSPAPPSQK